MVQMTATHWSTRQYHVTALAAPVIPLHPVNPFTTGHPVRSHATATRPSTPQGPQPHMHTLRRSPRQHFPQQASFSQMYQSHADGGPLNQDQPEQPRNSYERPTSRQSQYNERTTSRQGHHEQPSSRNHHNVRPESGQYQNTRPESRQYQNIQPESRRPQNVRPESRQYHHQGPETHQVQQIRPGSRLEQYLNQAVAHDMAQIRPPSRSTRPSSRPPSRLDGSDPVPPPGRVSERQRSRHTDAEGRAFRKDIAETTIAAINRGMDGVDLRSIKRYTKLYYEDDRDLINWTRPPRSFFGPPTTMEVNIVPLSTLKGTRFLTDTLKVRGKIGVLNFASATLPGGGFLTGARAQEESIARSSTLYVGLTTPAARPFYAANAADDRRGFYTHSMIYSPDVHLFRDDDGAWLPPLAVDVLTSPAVNAGQVRRQGRSTPAKLEERIQAEMHERMGRILALFERKKVRNLVLGSFGTGVFQNDVRAMAAIWHELLQAPGARFAGSFDHVVFAIPDESTAKQFQTGFRGRTSRHE
ncbi:hypothetical protein D9619_011688 [Psilocybe cf. subviscida]|uniref:Microbial-type PARG catalytic domain-containing protein n=1 Tax=Psilocybe cf. subviscida TaxID=2480587 RepID=A0A8H5BTA9_9AGAR|nr:hypothetical protein D9619_011688 [Psilocybe cf. subviscida]